MIPREDKQPFMGTAWFLVFMALAGAAALYTLIDSYYVIYRR